MGILSQIFFAIGALIHIVIFILEAIIWGKPQANKVFRVTKEQAEELRLFAFNQGFYNLFLTIQVFLGLGLYHFSNYPNAGVALTSFSAASMLMASLVLLYSSPELKRAFLIQGLAPAIGLIGLFL